MFFQSTGCRALRLKSWPCETVTVVPMGRDRSGRTVADVFLPDNRLLNHELVKEGFAWWYRRYAVENTVLEQLERDARRAKRGLWAEKEPVPPWEWRQHRRMPAAITPPSDSHHSKRPSVPRTRRTHGGPGWAAARLAISIPELFALAGTTLFDRPVMRPLAGAGRGPGCGTGVGRS